MVKIGKLTSGRERLRVDDLSFHLQVLTPEQHEQAERSEYNFDHADAFDWALACKTLRKLKEGKNAKVKYFVR